MMMLVLVPRVPQQPLKILKQGKKMILDIRRLTEDIGVSFDSWQAIVADILGTKRAAANNVPYHNC